MKAVETIGNWLLAPAYRFNYWFDGLPSTQRFLVFLAVVVPAAPVMELGILIEQYWITVVGMIWLMIATSLGVVRAFLVLDYRWLARAFGIVALVLLLAVVLIGLAITYPIPT